MIYLKELMVSEGRVNQRSLQEEALISTHLFLQPLFHSFEIDEPHLHLLNLNLKRKNLDSSLHESVQ